MVNDYYVYILASDRNGTLYIGITSNIVRRMNQHKNKEIKGFTEKYNVNKLVYLEKYEDVNEAIFREKKLKKWNRKWKLELIESVNPKWRDLSEDFIADE